jgi:uncharacterized protein YgiB involved in biofilm formation
VGNINKMKRTQTVSLALLRKAPRPFALRPLAVAVAGASLMACGQSRDAVIYSNVQECYADNPNNVAVCDTAYQGALEKSRDSAPKYGAQNECETQYGINNCVEHRQENGTSWFMPAMAGFMLGRALSNNRRDYAPIYTSYAYGSPYYGRWGTANGNVFSKNAGGHVQVSEDTFKSKPAVTSTLSRGGFGSTAAAKSNWGGSSSSGSWGG